MKNDYWKWFCDLIFLSCESLWLNESRNLIFFFLLLKLASGKLWVFYCFNILRLDLCDWILLTNYHFLSIEIWFVTRLSRRTWRKGKKQQRSLARLNARLLLFCIANNLRLCLLFFFCSVLFACHVCHGQAILWLF